MISTVWPRVFNSYTHKYCLSDVRMSQENPLNRVLFIKLCYNVLVLRFSCVSLFEWGRMVSIEVSHKFQWYIYFYTLTIIIHSQIHLHCAFFLSAFSLNISRCHSTVCEKTSESNIFTILMVKNCEVTTMDDGIFIRCIVRCCVCIKH